jgi:methyltransferase (TIGR00027 family)
VLNMTNNNRLILAATGAAALRAIESYRHKKDRLFEDRLARGFLKPFWRGIVELMRLPLIGTALLAIRERQVPGTIGGIICRTRYIDDALNDALTEHLDQVVILGAGFDTRAYRIPGIDETRVFEVDHPTTQAWKQTCLNRMFGTFPPHVVFVPIDFDQQDLAVEMEAAGFRTGAQTFYIWEGVTQYITAEAVDATVRYVATAAPGSRIVFTYIQHGVIDGRLEGAQQWVPMTRRYGTPWIFGLDPEELAQYLSARGLDLVEQVGASEYQERYLNPLGRHIAVFNIEKTALAQVAG